MSHYGFTYDKSGNMVKVYPPVYGNMKPVKKPRKTITNGSIPLGVGFSMNLNRSKVN